MDISIGKSYNHCKFRTLLSKSIMVKRKTRKKPSFIVAILSVAFVLFLLGLFTLLVFQTNTLLKQLKETIEVNIFVEDFASEDEIELLEQDLATKTYTKELRFISKDDAKQEFGEEFDMELLEENPLPASFSMFVESEYSHPDSLQVISAALEQHNTISEVIYQEDIVSILNTNVKKLAGVLLAASILFIVIAFTLIDSTIRLRIYSKRFIIKSMQLVGAKNSFITSPFIRTGILNGFISSVIALALLFGVIYFLNSRFQFLSVSRNMEFLLFLSLGVILFGVLLSVIATWFSVRKYLNAKIEDLY